MVNFSTTFWKLSLTEKKNVHKQKHSCINLNVASRKRKILASKLTFKDKLLKEMCSLFYCRFQSSSFKFTHYVKIQH